MLYIYTRHELDLDQFRTTLCDKLPSTTDLLVLYDVQYDHCLRHYRPAERQGRLFVGVPDDSEAEQVETTSCRKFGRRFSIASWEDLDQCSIVFVSSKADQDSSGEGAGRRARGNFGGDAGQPGFSAHHGAPAPDGAAGRQTVLHLPAGQAQCGKVGQLSGN